MWLKKSIGWALACVLAIMAWDGTTPLVVFTEGRGIGGQSPPLSPVKTKNMNEQTVY